MSKASWITAALDGSADAEKLKLLIDISYSLTSVRLKGLLRKSRGEEAKQLTSAHMRAFKY